jgi:hypothetical protein
MGNWEPIIWIVGAGVAIFALLLFIDFLKGMMKTRPRRDSLFDG